VTWSTSTPRSRAAPPRRGRTSRSADTSGPPARSRRVGSGSRRRRTVLREQDEGGGFSYLQSRCSDADAADATVPARPASCPRTRPGTTGLSRRRGTRRSTRSRPAGGPGIERAHGAGLADRHLMALADLGRRVAVELQRPRDRGDGVGQHRGRAGRRGRELGDVAHARRVMIAPGQQRLPGGRAQRGGVEPVVLEAIGGKPLLWCRFRRVLATHGSPASGATIIEPMKPLP
jgi:hypothetical protein